MMTTKFAAATFALSGVFLFNHDAALAKGPLEIEGQSPLILVKETPAEIDTKDFPWGLKEGRSENVRMNVDQEIQNPEGGEPISIGYSFLFPWMEVEKDGDDRVTISLDEQIITMKMPMEGDESIEMNVEMLYDNMSATFVRDGDRMKFEATADGFSGALDAPQMAEENVELVYKLSGKGLKLTGEGRAEQDWTDYRALDVSYDYTLDEMDLDLKLGGEGMGGQGMAAVVSFGKSQANGLFGKGLMEAGADMNDLSVVVSEPMPLEITASKMAMGIVLPTEPSPKPQDIKYMIEFAGIELSDQIWAMADPGEAFPRDLNRFIIDLEMKAMMMVSLLDPASMAEAEASGMPPLVPTSAKINSIAFDGLGLKVDATGEGALKGTQPEGEAYVTVKGLSDFVASAKQAGMFGDQEAMMVEGMAGQLGKEGDGGELVFDINTDGGMVNINGSPVMPLSELQ